MTFEDFIATRLPALLRHASVLAGDPHVAEDVVQDVLVRAHARWDRISRLDAPESYLRKMIVNELVSTRRRMVARLRRERNQEPPRREDHSEHVVQRSALVQLIRALPPRQRIVIALRYFEDMADADIAEILGCSLGTVRSQASRAVRTLREATALEPLRRNG